MGADFLIAICNSFNGTREEMQKRITDYCSALTCDDWSDWDLFLDPQTYEGSSTLDEFKAEILEYLTTCTNEIYISSRRDVGEVSLEGKSYLMTGGMSWGDIPTDAFSMINAIAWSGIDMEVTDG